MLPPDQSTWDQHRGRAGRSGQPARAFLAVEASAFQKVKPKRKQLKNEDGEDNRTDEGEQDEQDEHGEQDEQDEQDSDPFEQEPLQYRKKVDESLRQYIDTTGCRHNISDEYFNNPTPRPGARNPNYTVFFPS